MMKERLLKSEFYIQKYMGKAMAWSANGATSGGGMEKLAAAPPR
jgi:hypothetical protein